MKIIYWLEEYPATCQKSVFLAGPTARQGETPSWRPAAVEALRNLGYDGQIFIPEPRPGQSWPTYDQHDAVVDWEVNGLNRADCIFFWVPRDEKVLPGFTTNIEFGDFFKSGRVVLGAPETAVRMHYMKYRGLKESGIIMQSSLINTAEQAIRLIGVGALREGTEVLVPANIWMNKTFQYWYEEVRPVGYKLRYAIPLMAQYDERHILRSFAIKIGIGEIDGQLNRDLFLFGSPEGFYLNSSGGSVQNRGGKFTIF
ncbi:MAG: nucleoside 2-deoxyribosyltransferase domain-containing protein [Patescibacteria group bacterium]|jgi:hypothetical protein